MSVRSLSLAAILLAAGQYAPAAAADLCSAAQFKCNGFEPNWQFTTMLDSGGNPVVQFLDPENPGWEEGPLVVPACVVQGSPNDFEVTSGPPLSLTASIVGQSCTEPNGDVTNFSVTVTFNQGAATPNPNQVQGTGCCVRLD